MDGRWIGKDRILEQGGLNLYVYTTNSLYTYDYLGEAIPVVLLVVFSRAVVGAGVGLVSRAVGDLIEWKISRRSKYVAAAAGGAVGGLFGPPILSAFVSSLVESALNNFMAEEKSTRCQFIADVMINTVLTGGAKKFIEMPSLSSSIREILENINVDYNLVMVNLYKMVKPGGQNKIYKYLKEIYYELPGSTTAPIIRSSVSKGMEMTPKQLELHNEKDRKTQQPLELMGLPSVNHHSSTYMYDSK